MPAVIQAPAPPGSLILYNGHTFSNAANTTEFRATPVYDQAGRTITHTVFSITIEDYITGRPAEKRTEDVLSRLLQPAAGFIYRGRGTGGVNINFGGKSDMVWGPKPQMVSVKPLGGGNAVKITWQIQFATLNCGDAQTLPGGAMAYNFKVTWEVDKSGYTKRIYSGHLIIAATRDNQPDRRILHSADEYREEITPPLLEGYRRLPGTFTLDEAKTRLDFSIVDEQLPPNVPPPGVIDASITHDYSTPKVMGQTWSVNFEGEYELARGTHPSVAYKAFAALLKSRLEEVKRIQPTPAIIPINARVSEPNVYGRTIVRIGLGYTVVTAKLDQIIGNGGLWKPVPGSNWRLWAASIHKHLSSRGISRLTFQTGDDAIIDLCGAKEVELDGMKNQDRELRNGPMALPVELKRVFPAPTPKASFLHYQQSFHVQDDHGNIVVNTLPTKPIKEKNKSSGSWDAALRTLPIADDKSLFPPAADVQYANGGKLVSDDAEVSVQHRVSPVLYVYLIGHALRAGFPIPVPRLTDVNGVEPVLVTREGMGEGFTTWIVGNGAGVTPIYGAKWCLRYVLPRVPTGEIPVPPNSLLA